MPQQPVELAPGQISQLARAHVASLPDTAIGVLGWRCAAAFYRYVTRSASEHLFFQSDGDKVIAVAVVSTDPGGLFQRLWRHTPLVWYVLSGAPTFRRWGAAKTLWAGTVSVSRVKGYPELIFLFTSPDFRRRGIAGQLLTASEALLRSRGHDSYFVRTPNTQASPATCFYAGQGLTHSATKNGIQYWVKNLE